MQIYPLRILGELFFRGGNSVVRSAHQARNWRVLGEPLLLHEQFERADAAAPGRNFIIAGGIALAVEDRAHVQIMQQPSPRDAVGQFCNRLAGLHPADIRVRKPQPVEGDGLRLVERDLLLGSHGFSPWRAAAKLSPGRTDEHTSELQSLMSISYDVLC